jgi:hypothetical protein
MQPDFASYSTFISFPLAFFQQHFEYAEAPSSTDQGFGIFSPAAQWWMPMNRL